MVGKQELALCFRVARSKEQKPGRKRQISKSNLKIIEHKSILSIKTAFDQVNNNYQYAEITWLLMLISLQKPFQFLCKYCQKITQKESVYHKVASSRLSRLVAHPRIFRMLKVKFVPNMYCGPLAQKFQNWMINHSTARDFMVRQLILWQIVSRIIKPNQSN